MKDVGETDFNALISQAKTQFVIPIWQRTYAWEEDQWNDLWEDLKFIYEKRRKQTPIQHFMGPIVIKTVEEKVGEITRRILIDGQQRLTTLVLLCALIRDKANEKKNKELTDELEEDFLFNKFVKKEEYRAKIAPTEPDQKTFYSILDGNFNENKIYSSQLAYAYDHFGSLIDNSEYDLETLLECIRALKFVTIRLEEEDNANRIFETLNFRGKDLDQSDLIRNYYMMSITDEKSTERIYSNLWLPMQQSLGDTNSERAENMEEFFRHYTEMENKKTVRRGDVFPKVRESLKLSSEKEILDNLRTVKSYSTYYAKFLKPEIETDVDIRKGIERLNVLRITVHYPFLLKIYEGFSKHKLRKRTFLALLEILESYMVRRIFLAKNQAALNKLFVELCSLEANEDIVKSLSENLLSKESWSSQYWPSDEDFFKEFCTRPIYAVSNERCHFVLERLEEYFGHPEQANLSVMWVEHIMPQTLSNEWKSDLGNDWYRIFNEKLNTLGNLTLIAPAPDQSIQNKEFSDKKKEWYRYSNISLTKEVNKKWNTWGEEEIKKRAELLAKRALEIWPRPK